MLTWYNRAAYDDGMPRDSSKDCQGNRCHLVSANCRRLRRAYGLTQRELAARAHLPPATVSSVESTAGPWRTSTLERLAEAFGVSPAEFWRPSALVEPEHHGDKHPPLWAGRRECHLRASDPWG